MHKVEIDKLSNEFCNKFNKFHGGLKMDNREIGLFLRHYLPLVDAYVGYIERISTIEYHTYFNKKGGKKEKPPTWSSIQLKITKDEVLKKIIIDELFINEDETMTLEKSFENLLFIRNKITHNYFFYMENSQENINKFFKKINFLKFKKTIKIFGFDKKYKEGNEGYKNQSEKFVVEKFKVIDALLNNHMKEKDEKWNINIKKLLYISEEEWEQFGNDECCVKCTKRIENIKEGDDANN